MLLERRKIKRIEELELLPGDRVSWQGANRRVEGIVDLSEEMLVIRLPDEQAFRLSDIILSKSFKKEEQ